MLGPVGRMISYTCLSFVSHLSPTLGLVGGMISLPCLPFVFHLSPTLGLVGRMISFTCLPLAFHLFPLGSRSGSGWSHDFLHLSPICLSFVCRLSSTLGLVGRMISFTCLPFVFHLSLTWLPLWVRLVA